MLFQMRFRTFFALLLSLIAPAGSASADMRFNFENCYNKQASALSHAHALGILHYLVRYIALIQGILPTFWLDATVRVAFMPGSVNSGTRKRVRSGINTRSDTRQLPSERQKISPPGRLSFLLISQLVGKQPGGLLRFLFSFLCGCGA